MALTINPAVSGTNRRFAVHSFAFLASAFAGAAISGLAVMLAFGALGVVIPLAGLAALALVAVGWAVLHDLGVPIRMPYRPGQVPEWFRSAFPPAAVAVAFGFQLGAGFFTFFTYSTHVAMLAALPFVDSVPQMLAITLIFAVGKSIVLLMGVGVASVSEITPRFTSTGANLQLLRWTTAAASLVLSAVLVGSVVP